MKFIETFQLADFLDTSVSLALAFVLGTIIGAERQYRQRTAGLRTNVLVAVGAAAFVDLAMRIAGADGAVRVISYVVSGVGFLGAGVIMKNGTSISGLNTAATLWCSAAVGACAGADMAAQAALVTVLVVAGNTLLRPLVNAVNRIPIDTAASEASYSVSITAKKEQTADLRDELIEVLEQAQYPVHGVKVSDRGEGMKAIIATLVSTSVVEDELDAVVKKLELLDGVLEADWEGTTLN